MVKKTQPTAPTAMLVIGAQSSTIKEVSDALMLILNSPNCGDSVKTAAIEALKSVSQVNGLTI